MLSQATHSAKQLPSPPATHQAMNSKNTNNKRNLHEEMESKMLGHKFLVSFEDQSSGEGSGAVSGLDLDDEGEGYEDGWLWSECNNLEGALKSASYRWQWYDSDKMQVRGLGTADDLRTLILKELDTIEDFKDIMSSRVWYGGVPKAFTSLENFKDAVRVELCPTRDEATVSAAWMGFHGEIEELNLDNIDGAENEDEEDEDDEDDENGLGAILDAYARAHRDLKEKLQGLRGDREKERIRQEVFETLETIVRLSGEATRDDDELQAGLHFVAQNVEDCA